MFNHVHALWLFDLNMSHFGTQWYHSTPKKSPTLVATCDGNAIFVAASKCFIALRALDASPPTIVLPFNGLVGGKIEGNFLKPLGFCFLVISTGYPKLISNHPNHYGIETHSDFGSLVLRTPQMVLPSKLAEEKTWWYKLVEEWKLCRILAKNIRVVVEPPSQHDMSQWACGFSFEYWGPAWKRLGDAPSRPLANWRISWYTSAVSCQAEVISRAGNLGLFENGGLTPKIWGFP